MLVECYLAWVFGAGIIRVGYEGWIYNFRNRHYYYHYHHLLHYYLYHSAHLPLLRPFLLQPLAIVDAPVQLARSNKLTSHHAP